MSRLFNGWLLLSSCWSNLSFSGRHFLLEILGINAADRLHLSLLLLMLPKLFCYRQFPLYLCQPEDRQAEVARLRCERIALRMRNMGSSITHTQRWH